jgi:hypothetical protein
LDIALWILMNAAILLDWGQTRTIATEMTPTVTTAYADGSITTLNPYPRYREMNPVLGERPSRKQVDRFFVASLLINNAVCLVLPPEKRKWYAGAVAAIEIGIVVHNGALGIGFAF